MSCDYRFISDFLATVEGPRQTTGYIPCFLKAGGTANYKGGPGPDRYQAMDKSGVPIATGCDLGQTDATTMAAYGLDSGIIGIFKDYFGKKQDRAIRMLYAYPLVITPDAARQTDEAVHKGYLCRYVIPAYEKDSGRKFVGLPQKAQAVIMSLCFHYGCNGARTRAPKTWAYLCKADWQAAANELITGFTGKYAGRRKKEGEFLKGAA